jgi:hypothetical protein
MDACLRGGDIDHHHKPFQSMPMSLSVGEEHFGLAEDVGKFAGKKQVSVTGTGT